MEYEQPTPTNVNLNGELIADYIGNTGVFKITEVNNEYLIGWVKDGFVKSFYDEAIVKQNGKLFVGKKVTKSRLIKALEVIGDLK